MYVPGGSTPLLSITSCNAAVSAKFPLLGINTVSLGFCRTIIIALFPRRWDVVVVAQAGQAVSGSTESRNVVGLSRKGGLRGALIRKLISIACNTDDFP
jgi:hypothetical protein